MPVNQLATLRKKYFGRIVNLLLHDGILCTMFAIAKGKYLVRLILLLSFLI